MKRVLTIAFAFLLTSSLALVAQETGNPAPKDKKAIKVEKQEADASAKGKVVSLTGWIKTEGDKPTFVNDQDKASWSIENPDAVKGHENHHVKVKAKLNDGAHSVNIESLKMMREGKQ